MPNQLSVSVPYRWLLPFFPQLHHIQSVQLSTFFVLFLFRCFFVSRIGNVWTLHLQSKIDSTDQTVEHDQEVG